MFEGEFILSIRIGAINARSFGDASEHKPALDRNKSLTKIIMTKAKALFVSCLPALLLTAFAPALMAGTIKVGDTVYVDKYNTTNNAGEFTFYINAVNGPTLTTYCIEEAEYIYLGVGSLVYDISNTILSSSADYPPGYDQLKPQVDYLYALYWNSGLTTALAGTTYNFNKNSLGDQAALQNVLWYFQWGKPVPGTGLETALMNLAARRTGSYGTQVINLGYGSLDTHNNFTGDPAQSQLMYVPEPALVILLGIGLAGVALATRKMI